MPHGGRDAGDQNAPGAVEPPAAGAIQKDRIGRGGGNDRRVTDQPAPQRQELMQIALGFVGEIAQAGAEGAGLSEGHADAHAAGGGARATIGDDLARGDGLNQRQRIKPKLWLAAQNPIDRPMRQAHTYDPVGKRHGKSPEKCFSRFFLRDHE